MNAHVEEYKKHTIEIKYDECPENPFTSWDGEGKIVFHPNSEYSCNTDLSYKDAQETKFSVPLSAYIHSGIALSVMGEGHQCRWDTSNYIAYWVPDQENNPIKTRKQAVKTSRQACKLFNQWANGEVYGFNIPEIDESCWGFYGDIEHCINEARSVIDWQIEENKKGLAMFHALA